MTADWLAMHSEKWPTIEQISLRLQNVGLSNWQLQIYAPTGAEFSRSTNAKPISMDQSVVFVNGVAVGPWK
jgi:hypothetical protein